MDDPSDHHEDSRTQSNDSQVVEPTGRGPYSPTEPIGYIVIERPSTLDLFCVLGNDPAKPENTNRCDYHRQSSSRTGTITGDRGDTHHEWNKKCD